jgi:D-glycero-D-manno-heptose 1,7-bisphosphate phosphatase
VNGRKAAFLDRDGVLNGLVPDPASGLPESPLQVGDVQLLAGAASSVRELQRAGYELVCVSNQPAGAKGKVSKEQLWTVHRRVVELLENEGVRLNASRLCMHHPDGIVPELSGACDCRKPAPGMLLSAAEELGLDLGESWMIGDTDTDILAGQAAGCRTVLIECAGSARKRAGSVRPDLVAADLAAAVIALLDSPSR